MGLTEALSESLPGPEPAPPVLGLVPEGAADAPMQQSSPKVYFWEPELELLLCRGLTKASPVSVS